MLNTVDSVIEAVGGTTAAAELAGVTPPAVSNWSARGKIARGKFMLFRDVLASKGFEVSPVVFGLEVRDEART